MNYIYRMLKKITEKELIVLRLIIEGHNTKEIAKTLGNSANTIEDVRKRMCMRYGAKNGYEMISIAYKEGILKP